MPAWQGAFASDDLNSSATSQDRAAESTENDPEYPEGENAPTEAESRELGAEEDPEASSNLEREARIEKMEKTGVDHKTGVDIYSSIRIRYREQRGERAWEDGGSRLGISADHRFLAETFVVGRFEAGFNVLSALNPSDSAEEFKDTFFSRLGYIGLDTLSTQVTVGKNWSTYYEVGAFTDRFMGAGGDGSGVFNAQTDGGPTGTGRADRVLQTRISLPFPPRLEFKPLEIKVQLQNGNSIPFGKGAKYDAAVGISTLFVTESNLSIGIAYNHAEIDLDKNPSLREIGITGSARALIVGVRSFGERWYAGGVVARLENHETTDGGTYFDGWGSEIYAQYHLTDRLWLVGGYNALEPDSDQVKAGGYRIRYTVAGARYSFDDFRRMIYGNVRINAGRDADGSQESDIYTIGIRWDF